MMSTTEGRRILVVDDERVIADSLTAILCTQGYSAKAVYSAAGAMAAAHDLTPDTVISDVFMPEMNGIELASYFAENHPTCAVMLMSGDDSAPALLDAALRQARPLSRQNKPVTPTQILEWLSSLAPIN
ncbi:MAG TPA: response regulator [Terracidiphilus sp.]|jgi:DNA-binding NtrC family response regulator